MNDIFKLPTTGNWDQDGALPIALEVKNNAYTLLKELITTYNFIFHIKPDSPNQFINPIIKPVADGTIDFIWKNEQATLVLNINNSSDVDFSLFMCKSLDATELTYESRALGKFNRSTNSIEFFRMFMQYYQHFVVNSSTHESQIRISKHRSQTHSGMV